MSAAIIILLAVARMFGACLSGLATGLYRTTTHVAMRAHLGEAAGSLLHMATASVAVRYGGGQPSANANIVHRLAKAVSMSRLATAKEESAPPIGRRPDGDEAHLRADTAIIISAATRATAGASAALLPCEQPGRIVSSICDDPVASHFSRQDRQIKLAPLLYLTWPFPPRATPKAARARARLGFEPLDGNIPSRKQP